MPTPKKNIHAQALGRLGRGKTSERKKKSSRLNALLSAYKRRQRRELQGKLADKESA